MKAGQVSGGAAHSEPASGKAGTTSSSSSSRKDSARAKEKSSSRAGAGQPEVRSKETGLAGHYHSEPSSTSTISAHVSRDVLSERQGIKSEPSGVTGRSAEKSVEKSTVIHRSLKSPEKTRKSEKHEKSTAASRDERRSPPEHSSSPSRRAQPGGASPVREVASQIGAAETVSSSNSEVSYQTILPGGILFEPATKTRSHAKSGKTSSGEGTGKQRMSPPLLAEPGPGYVSIPTMPLSSLSSSDEISYQTVLPGGQLAPVNKPRSPGKPGKTVSGEGSEQSATASARNHTSPSQSSTRSTIVTAAGEPPPYKFAAESGRRPRTGSAGASDAARLSTAAKHATASGTATRTTTVSTTIGTTAGTTTTATATTSTTAGATKRPAIPSGHISLSPSLKPHGEATAPGFGAMGAKKRASPPQQSHTKSSGASRTRTLQGTADGPRADDESSSTISISTSTFSQLGIGGSASRRGKGGAGEEHQKRVPASASSSGKVRRSSLDETSSSSRSSERSSEYSSEKIVPGMRKAKSYTKPGGSRLDDFSQSEDRSGSLSRWVNLASMPPSSAKAPTSTAKAMDSADQSHTDTISRQPRVPLNAITEKPPRPPFDLQKAMEAPDTLDELRHPDAPLPWQRRLLAPECEIEQYMWDTETVIESLQCGGLNDRQRFQAKRLWVLRPLKDQLVDAVYQTDRNAFAATFATLHEKTIAYGQEYQLPHPWGLEATLSKVLQEIVTDPLAHASTLRWLVAQLAARVPAEHLPLPWTYALAKVFKAAYAEKTPGKYTEQFNVLHEHCWRIGRRGAIYMEMEMKSLAARVSREEEESWGFKNYSYLERQSVRASPLSMAMWRKILSVPRAVMHECTPGGNRQATVMAAKTARELLLTTQYDEPHLSQSQFHDYILLACHQDSPHFIDGIVSEPNIRPGSGIVRREMDVATANVRTREMRAHVEGVAKEFGATKILTYLAHWPEIVPYHVGLEWQHGILKALFGSPV
ncbi:hypothetical protein MW7_009000 [Imbroritus primus]|uniref:Uncharacterized protein n=1 Tax=Imbroritus primus TaxID=3058603 RepID=A0ACD3SRF3_9BURK|nr:hypothetical protein MW7_009000 [Burkholderiaceae bacterium PBA]